MQSPSPSQSKVEVIKQAIKQLMEEVESSSEDGNHHHSLLSKLMSQLEWLEAEPEAYAEGLAFPAVSKLDSTGDNEATKVNSNVTRSEEEEEEEEEEERIAKELNYVKRQNFITHCLLSVMIVVTIVWQVSEVSMILKLKDRVSHPFRSISGLFKGMIKPPKANGNEEESQSSITSITSDLIESSPMHDLKIPELPKIDMGFQDEE